MQRIFKHGDIQNTILTPDKELNMLIYWPPSDVIIYENYTLLKTVRFFLAHFDDFLTHHRLQCVDVLLPSCRGLLPLLTCPCSSLHLAPAQSFKFTCRNSIIQINIGDRAPIWNKKRWPLHCAPPYKKTEDHGTEVTTHQHMEDMEGPVSTEVGDRIRVQFPVRDIYLGMWPATQVSSAWPSLRG